MSLLFGQKKEHNTRRYKMALFGMENTKKMQDFCSKVPGRMGILHISTWLVACVCFFRYQWDGLISLCIYIYYIYIFPMGGWKPLSSRADSVDLDWTFVGSWIRVHLSESNKRNPCYSYNRSMERSCSYKSKLCEFCKKSRRIIANPWTFPFTPQNDPCNSLRSCKNLDCLLILAILRGTLRVMVLM